MAGEADDAPWRRTLAEIIFSNVEKFHAGELIDFARGRVRIVAIIDDQLRKKPEMRSRLKKELNACNSWREVILLICQHKQFSEGFNPKSFHDLWGIIQGFDVDGLLDIGDPAALQDLRDSPEGNQAILARHRLGAAIKTTLAAEAPLFGRDDHLHFGQMLDTNIVWLAQLRSSACYLSNSYKSGQANEPKTFAETRHRAKYGDNAWAQMSTEIDPKIATQRLAWDANLSRCRLLLGYTKLKTLGEDSSDLQRFLEGLLSTNDALMKVEIDFVKQCTAIEDEDFDELVIRERELLANLHNLAPSSDEYTIGLAYLLFKSAAMHENSANRVSEFEDFTTALRVLFYIHQKDSTIFRSGTLQSFVTQQMRHSGTGFHEVRCRVNDKLFKNRTDLEDWKRSLRYYGNFAQDIAFTFETPSEGPGLTLAFSRHDFEKLERQPGDTRQAVEDLKCRVLDMVHELPVAVYGIDLIGPESRTKHGNDDQHSLTSEVSEGLLRLSQDFVFDLRDRIEKKPGEGKSLFATFHAGEHVDNHVLGVLSLLSILSDSRFRPETDRISHGLILGMTLNIVKIDDEDVRKIADQTVGAMIDSSRSWENDLFNDKERTRLLQIITNYQKNTASPVLEEFEEACALIKAKIKAGRLRLEVCPYSNEMIETSVEATSHFWADVYEQDNVFIGTDDPSLTQTLPWMERSALALAKSRSV